MKHVNCVNLVGHGQSQVNKVFGEQNQVCPTKLFFSILEITKILDVTVNK